jgi:uncharacterized protein YyaL (SSP411 family)
LDTLRRLVDWFISSPIFSGEAYLEYYSPTKNGLEYPEITAYATSLSCLLYRDKKDSTFLERAKTCADYMNKISQAGGIPCLRDNILYAFDTGVYISSLFDLYSLTDKESYLDEAERSLDWLASLWNRRRFAAVDRLPRSRDWYHVPSVHLAKLMMGFLKASEYLEDEKYMKEAFMLSDKYAKLQDKDGGFMINDTSTAIMVHPHCYATEGFLYAYYISKHREFLEIAEKASDWLGKMQNSDGSFYTWYNAEKEAKHRQRQRKIKTTDATAQATRIWKLLGVNREGIEKAYGYLDGEFEDNGLRLYNTPCGRRFVYSWPTFFYLHSLILPYGQVGYSKELF